MISPRTTAHRSAPPSPIFKSPKITLSHPKITPRNYQGGNLGWVTRFFRRRTKNRFFLRQNPFFSETSEEPHKEEYHRNNFLGDTQYRPKINNKYLSGSPSRGWTLAGSIKATGQIPNEREMPSPSKDYTKSKPYDKY